MRDDTKLIHMARNTSDEECGVNLPVHRASTVVYADVASYLSRFDGERRYNSVTYGATGTHNARALAGAIAELENGAGCVVTSTGLSAITMTLSALLASGDHLLMTDSVYGPSRTFCNTILARMGVRTTYYDPGIGAGIADLIEDTTRLIFTEAPGSLTFEMQDIPAIVAAARKRDVLVAMDNTWATPLYYRPIDHGVDVSIQAGTKYVAGHSDLVIGMISSASQEVHRRIFDSTRSFGDVASPDDCFLALRGLRTMSVRLRQQSEAALRVARWLEARSEVKRVLFPPLESDPGHALWARDFAGSTSLFGLVLESTDLDVTSRFVESLKLFSIGSSWGGYESLVAVNVMPLPREVVPFNEAPYLLRLHIGLEDADDLIADLEGAFVALG
jgi:cysteine-S-conjugate beta-lyase